MDYNKIKEKGATLDGRNIVDLGRVRIIKSRKNDEWCNNDNNDEIIYIIDNKRGWRRPTRLRRTGRRCGYIVELEPIGGSAKRIARALKFI